ncbi:hypothetical protein PVT71_08265 [Salipiger sp. H15]|uniref:Uncharacterized protein n=1 Tax=Alloyangia sp. H15 TaxID=3029062 RepID=A0AAU8AD95_9RHOB
MRHLPWIALACVLLGLAPPPCRAGAWLPPRGTGFASTTTRLTWSQDVALQGWQAPQGRYDTLFLDYGLGDHLALGADLGRSISGGGKALVFLRWPLLGTGPLRVAAEMGLGRIAGTAALRPGLSVGLGHARGWLNADLLAEMRGTGETDLKLDLTLGAALPREAKLILQIQSGVQAGDAPFARFAPSVVLPLRRSLQTELGLSWGMAGDTSAGLLLGLWTEF